MEMAKDVIVLSNSDRDNMGEDIAGSDACFYHVCVNF